METATSAPWDESFESILRRALRFLPEHAPLEPYSELAVLGLDSMHLIQLMLGLEETYSITFPSDYLDMGRFTTPSSVWQMVTALNGVR